MVTGSNSKSSRGKSRYYVCGTYHRKGPKACKRNIIYKDLIEDSVINTLIREFSILAYPESLEEEIRKYQKYKNRENQFELARIDDDIQRLLRRLEAANNDVNKNENIGFFTDYISQLENDISQLKDEKDNLLSRQIDDNPSNDMMKTI